MPRYLVPPPSPPSAPAHPGAQAPPGATPSPAGCRLRPADLAQVARSALDRRKLLVAFLGLVAAAMGFFLFASLGNLTRSGFWATALRAVGAALGYLVLAFTCFVQARMEAFEVRTGGVRPGIVDTLRACLGRLGALCSTPGGLVLGAVVAALLVAFLAWLGRIIPTVFTFFFLVEFALGAAVVAAGIILTWGLFLYPAILAVEELDELDTIRRYLGLYRRHGLALAGYQVVVMAASWLAAAAPGVLSALALATVGGISRRIMAGAFLRSLARVPQVFGQIAAAWLKVVTAGAVSGLEDLFGPAAPRADGVQYGFSGAFLGASLLVIAAAALSYALVFFATAGARVYLAYAPREPGATAEQRAAA